MAIHKTAIIDENAKIAPDVEIGAYTVIGKDVVIEKGVTIGNNVSIEFATIGEGTKIAPFASIGGEPQDLGYKGEKTGVTIGKNCWIREFSTVNRGSGEGTNTIIGGHVHVGFGAWLGGMSVFHQNVRIGEMAIISGASASRVDILPYTKSEGLPAIAIGVNAIGLRRKGVDKASVDAIHKAVRILKSTDYNTTQAIEKIEKEVEKNSYVDKLIEFIKTSKRGVNIKTNKEFIKAGNDFNE